MYPAAVTVVRPMFERGKRPNASYQLLCRAVLSKIGIVVEKCETRNAFAWLANLLGDDSIYVCNMCVYIYIYIYIHDISYIMYNTYTCHNRYQSDYLSCHWIPATHSSGTSVESGGLDVMENIAIGNCYRWLHLSKNSDVPLNSVNLLQGIWWFMNLLAYVCVKPSVLPRWWWYNVGFCTANRRTGTTRRRGALTLE